MQQADVSGKIMFIENNPMLSVFLLAAAWIFVGAVVVLMRNAIDPWVRGDSAAWVGLRAIAWPLELFYVVLLSMALCVGMFLLSIARVVCWITK